MNMALPISPLKRVSDGPGPWRNPLHVVLLVLVWFLPMTVFLVDFSGYGHSGYYWSEVVQFLGPWLVVFTVLATVLSAFVGRGASVAWTLTVHGAAVLLVLMWIVLR